MVIVQHYRAHVALPVVRVWVHACVRAWAGSAAYGTRIALLYAAKIGIGHGRVTVTLHSRLASTHRRG